MCCIYSYSHKDIHTKSLSLSLLIYIYLYVLYTYCWNTIQIFDVPNPQKNPPFLFRGFSCVSRCSSGPHAFVRRRWKPLRLENYDPWRFLCANCELGGVSDCFGWFSIFGGILPHLRICMIWGISKTTNNQQLTIFWSMVLKHFQLGSCKVIYIVSSFKAVWNTSNTQPIESMGLVYLPTWMLDFYVKRVV